MAQKINITELPLVGQSYAKKLSKIEIETVWDLFHHIPFRFLDFSKKTSIKDLQIGEITTIKGRVTSYVNQYTKKGKPMQIVTIADDTGKVNAIWFNQIYLSRTFREGTNVAIAGELSWLGRQKAIIAPEYEILTETGDQIHTGKLVPIYGVTAGISPKWLRRRIYDAWKRYKDQFEEFLPLEILKKYNLLEFKEAMEKVHFPKSLEDFEKGKKRLAFNELLGLHTRNIKNKKSWQKNKTQKLESGKWKVEIDSFIRSLPFELTSSQNKVAKEILKDLESDIPMNRLLEGDVGSGKTVVAVIAMYSVFLNKKKSILMAPTQILANQHYETLIQLFSKIKTIKIGLVTSVSKKSENANIIVGTHAILGKGVNTKDVSLIIIDEQHKFGVEQRKSLEKKSGTPHVLTMTATPIPRTVALTFFGDLDLSVLDELPLGRQKIITWVVPEKKREGAYAWIKTQITNFKSQIFVVCPLIETSETETMKDVKSVTSEYSKIKTIFKELKVGLLHGRLKSKEKEEVIEKFKKGKLDILVTTPVVEVGVDIPSATIMMIEAADRFGLASLHQLRGRVGRSEKKSYCLLMTESESEKVQTRLMAMTKYNSGFALSEIDLALRGPGEIYGTRQSGIPELKIASWEDLSMIKDTRKVADELLNKL